MPQGAPIHWGGSIGAKTVFASVNHPLPHRRQLSIKQTHQRATHRVIMCPFIVVLLVLVSCSNVFCNENGDITNGYSLGPDITSTTEFGKFSVGLAIRPFILDQVNEIYNSYIIFPIIHHTQIRITYFRINIKMKKVLGSYMLGAYFTFKIVRQRHTKFCFSVKSVQVSF